MNRLREIRRSKGLTAKELGELVGKAEVTITQYEVGGRNPTRATLEKLADVLEVSVDYLLGKEKDPAQVDLSRVDAGLYSELSSLSPQEQDAVRIFIAGLKANRPKE